MSCLPPALSPQFSDRVECVGELHATHSFARSYCADACKGSWVDLSDETSDAENSIEHSWCAGGGLDVLPVCGSLLLVRGRRVEKPTSSAQEPRSSKTSEKQGGSTAGARETDRKGASMQELRGWQDSQRCQVRRSAWIRAYHPWRH